MVWGVVEVVDGMLAELDVVEPDLLHISRKRMGERETWPWVRGAPDLVIEIGSPATRQRDETIKRRLYELFGVAEYWVIDPELDTIKVYRRSDERYERTAELSLESSHSLTSPLFPSLQLPSGEIFEY